MKIIATSARVSLTRWIVVNYCSFHLHQKEDFFYISNFFITFFGSYRDYCSSKGQELDAYSCFFEGINCEMWFVYVYCFSNYFDCKFIFWKCFFIFWVIPWLTLTLTGSDFNRKDHCTSEYKCRTFYYNRCSSFPLQCSSEVFFSGCCASAQNKYTLILEEIVQKLLVSCSLDFCGWTAVNMEPVVRLPQLIGCKVHHKFCEFGFCSWPWVLSLFWCILLMRDGC